MKYTNEKKKGGGFKKGGKKSSSDRDPFFEEETKKRRKISYGDDDIESVDSDAEENGFTGGEEGGKRVDLEVEDEDETAGEKRKRLAEEMLNRMREAKRRERDEEDDDEEDEDESLKKSLMQKLQEDSGRIRRVIASSHTMENEEYRNWAELPPELLSTILHRLGALEILENAQKVCRSWRRVCTDPSMWRVIDIHDYGYSRYIHRGRMCRRAVDLSQGGLVEIDLWVDSEDILKYIADRSSDLKSLRLMNCSGITNKEFVEAVVKLPRLEVLEVSRCWLSGESLKVLGQSCPNLKTLKVNRRVRIEENDEDALAIAETMHGLHQLQLCGNGLSDTGLKSILDNCPNLEHLDIRKCSNVKLVGDLQKRCYERVRVVRHPSDSTHDYPFGPSDTDSSDDEYGCDFYDSIDMYEENDGFGEYPPYDYDYYCDVHYESGYDF